MNRTTRLLLIFAVLASGTAACRPDNQAAVTGEARSSTSAGPSTVAAGSTITVLAEIWADNWFELAVDGIVVGRDTVPFATERSFNAETFTFSARLPFTLALTARDYLASDSGLEYLGTPRQQLGDGGIIAQFTDVATGRTLAVTDSTWRALVVHRAPLDESCASSPDPDLSCTAEISPTPAAWTTPSFDDRSWTPVRVWTETEVGVKDGYRTITWRPEAHLVWSEDLRKDNTVLLRKAVVAAP